MLEAAGVPFEAASAGIDEEEAKAGLIAAGFEPRDLAEMLAETKARSAGPADGALVLGADQVLERNDGSILSKPAYEHGARKLEPQTGPDPNDDFSQEAAENKKPQKGMGLTETAPRSPEKPKQPDERPPRDTKDSPAANPNGDD